MMPQIKEPVHARLWNAQPPGQFSLSNAGGKELAVQLRFRSLQGREPDHSVFPVRGLTRARQLPAVVNVFLHERLQQGDRHLACFCFSVPLCYSPTEVADRDNESPLFGRLEPCWIFHMDAYLGFIP